MHTVLSTFFAGPVSGKEKKRRLMQRVHCVFSSPLFPVVSFLSLFVCKLFWLISITHTSTLLAETNKTDPTQYVLTLEQMIKNDYLILS